MKKAVFILALVAVVIGSVYAGTVIAAPKPATSGPVQMETLSGRGDQGDFGTLVVVEKTYPNIRHVSLTMEAFWDDSDPGVSRVWVEAKAAGSQVFRRLWEGVGNPPQYPAGYANENLQFDADHWKICISGNRNPAITGGQYSATVMYYAQ